MSEVMKIDKTIPVPCGKYTKTLLEMEIGDSVVCTKIERDILMKKGYRNKIKITSRKIEDNKYRVWRTE